MQWICTDASGDLSVLGRFDVVFSNAAIQWMPRQDELLRKLFGMLNSNGILAVQVPCTEYMPVHTELEKLAASDAWKNRLVGMSSSYSVHAADFYYNILSGLTMGIDLWVTDYFHIMNSHGDIVNWYSGSGLRPYLDCLADGEAQAAFRQESEDALKAQYPVQPDGKILFPFTRIFFIVKNL
jgi:trans-aconitate 2-methyltransferase